MLTGKAHFSEKKKYQRLLYYHSTFQGLVIYVCNKELKQNKNSFYTNIQTKLFDDE